MGSMGLKKMTREAKLAAKREAKRQKKLQRREQIRQGREPTGGGEGVSNDLGR
jgi:hypothetical protein